ncbi:MAG: Gfo/Idh/MocA family oxidoreductase [Candidatus Omnitrophica bacterium]|nr:Gfo/Idh/MocA family oxidoreductase [Candidatus Omnitrophota bacterium]
MNEKKQVVQIGVVGCGQWGPNQIRSFFFHPGTSVKRVADLSESRLEFIRSTYTGIETTQNHLDITEAKDIDAVVITTPVFTHFEIAKSALVNGKDVLCEKPLTLSVDEAQELVDLAKKHRRILMVGHVFLFNPGIQKMKEFLKAGEIGKIYYLHAKRTNLGPIRSDVNSVYDLASHDISVFNYLLDGEPEVVSATGRCFLQPEVEDVAFITLRYSENVLAHIHVSWLDPKKIRQLTVVGDQKMMTWDDLSQSGPLEIYSKTVEKTPYYKGFGEFHLLAKDGEVRIPRVPVAEPLRIQTDHFVDCVINRTQPVCDGQNGLSVVRTIDEINRKLKDS